jgi:thiol-disulfide isomerase/thioredoxin
MRNHRLWRASLSILLLWGVPAHSEPAPGSETKPDATPARKPGEAAPPFMLKILNPQDSGPRVFDLRSYVGDDAEHPAKVLLASFFATWCHPCRQELPALVKLAATYRDQGLQVLSIAIDKEQDGIAQIPQIVHDNSVVHPVVSDNLNIVARRYLGSDVKLPSLVMIGKDGTIIALHQGYGEELKASLEGEVRQALGLAPEPSAGRKGATHRATAAAGQ